MGEPYHLDSARALIAQMRNVRFAQLGVWLQIGIETSGRLIGDIAVRVDGDNGGLAGPLTRKATGTLPKHYAQSSHCCSPSTTYRLINRALDIAATSTRSANYVVEPDTAPAYRIQARNPRIPSLNAFGA